MLRFQCIQIFWCLFSFQRFYNLDAKFDNINNNIISLKDRELPIEQDLLIYLKAIELTNIYCTENKNKIDVNLAFGLFLANVNFKRIIKEKEGLPYIIKTKLRNIIRKNEKNLKEFINSTKNDTIFKTAEFQQVLRLLINSSQWVDRCGNLVVTNLKSHNLNKLKYLYPPWEYYSQDVKNKGNWTPNPELSDMCLVSLSSNDIVDKGYKSCFLEVSCYEMLIGGSNFGYALTHRLLLLLAADLGHGCYIFSPKQDNALKYKFCSMAYAEVEYIAMNNYELADLMMEIMCLCSLEGHAQFLRRSWLQKMLYFQKPPGCFGSTTTTSEVLGSFDGRRFHFNSRYQNVSQDDCDVHTTAVASGVFSVAIRYIIQEYY